MRKSILTIVAIAMCFMTTNAQQRLVLYEEFTGENCPPCASTNPGLLALMMSGSNPNKILMIKYLSPIPSAGKLYNSNKSQTDIRTSYYSVPFAPYGRMDGGVPSIMGATTNQGHPGYMNQSIIDSESSVPPLFNITAVQRINATKDSVSVDISVTALAATTGTYVLRAAWVKNMTFSSSAGTNGETTFENVVRRMYPGTGGTAVPSSWTAGTNNHYTIKGAIKGLDTFTNVTSNDSFMVVWMQNDNAIKNVAQAAKATTAPPASVGNTVLSIDGVTIYPNPAKDKATIKFTLLSASDVNVIITDAAGRTTGNTFSSHFAGGTQKMEIPTNNLAAGIYSITLKTDANSLTQQLTIVR
ncbi:MAG: T9SS type A sorting domain-containing protein [Taibaiella sp.]|nr:T9SS type A sorting domain-containing protein [Taibaiella sp.]